MKIIKYLTLFCGLTLWGNFTANAQYYTIKGQINDSETHEALSNVYVTTADSTLYTASDDDGKFELKTKTSEGELNFSLMGYKTVNVSYDSNHTELNIFLSPDNLTLGDVLVKSFNSNKRNKDTPGAIAVLTGKQLKMGDGSSFKEGLNSVPGVQLDQSNLADSRISIRGNGIRSPWGIRNTKVYINDIPVTETDGTTRIEALNVADIGRAEIIRGPASSIYGGNSTGGVINFELQKPDYGQKSLEAEGLVGSYGLHRVTSNYKSRTENLSSFIGYGYQEYNGYRQNSWDIRRFLAGNFEFSPSEKQTFTLLVNRTSEDSRIPGLLTKSQVKENRRQAAASELDKKAGRYQRWIRVGLGQKYRFNSKWSNSTSLFTYFYDLHHPLAFAVIRNTYQSYGGRTHFTFKPGFETFDTKFTAGAEFNQGKTKGTQYVNNQGVEGNLMSNVDYKNTYYTLFYQSETKLTSKATLTLGLSYNNLDYDVMDFLNPSAGGLKKFDNSVDPRIALSYDFGEHLSLHGSLSKGFSAPTTGEISNADGTLNQSVDAEKALNYELNAKGGFLDSRLNYDFALYLMDMKGELIGQTITQGTTVYHNSGKTRHIGAELAVGYQILRKEDEHAVTSLKPYLSLTYLHAEFRDYKILDANNQIEANYDGHKLAGIAPWLAYVGVDLETKWGFYFNGSFRYNDTYALNDANTDYNPSYQLINGKIGYRTNLWKHLDLNIYGGVNNITNAKYSSFTAINAQDYGGGPAYYDPSPGINGYGGISLKYNFN